MKITVNSLFQATHPARSAYLCVWLALAAPLVAEEPALPSADEVLAKHIEMTGGREAHEKVHNRVSKGTLEYVGIGIKGKVEACESAPNKVYVRVEFENMGRAEEGCNGTVAWEQSAMQGARVLEGDELKTKLRQSAFNALLKWKELYKEARCTGVEAVNDTPCYKVVLTPHVGAPETLYIDKATYRVLRVQTVLQSALGEMPVEMESQDYRQVDGLWLPFKSVQKVMMQEIHVTFDSIEHNVELPPDRFALPEAIQALLAKSDAGAGESPTPPPAPKKPAGPSAY